MTIYCGVYPAESSPVKSQIERFLALFGTPSPEMIQDFRLELYPGPDEYWEIKAPLPAARRQFYRYYKAASPKIQREFQLIYFHGAVGYLNEILANMQQAGVPVADLYSQLRQLSLATKGRIRDLPEEAQKGEANGNSQRGTPQ